MVQILIVAGMLLAAVAYLGSISDEDFFTMEPELVYLVSTMAAALWIWAFVLAGAWALLLAALGSGFPALCGLYCFICFEVLERDDADDCARRDRGMEAA